MPATHKARTLLAILLAVAVSARSPCWGQPGEPDPAYQQLAAAFRALETGDLEPAADAFRQALELSPEFGNLDTVDQARQLVHMGLRPALRGRGALADSLKEFESAGELWEQVLERMPDDHPKRSAVLRAVGMTNVWRGRHADAAATFDRGLEVARATGERYCCPAASGAVRGRRERTT